MTTIYVIKCERGMYYVGRTDRPLSSRIEEHFCNYGSEWTKVHKPLSVMEVHNNAHVMDEDKITKMYMSTYGIDNVRGGSYGSIVLPEYKVKALMDEMCTAQNACFKCKAVGHYANMCPHYTSFQCPYCGLQCNSQDYLDHHKTFCYDRPNKGIFGACADFIAMRGLPRRVHRSNTYLNHTNQRNTCYRCGRYGHYANTCFANTHFNGKRLS